jgi:hypothetical protein
MAKPAGLAPDDQFWYAAELAVGENGEPLIVLPLPNVSLNIKVACELNGDRNTATTGMIVLRCFILMLKICLWLTASSFPNRKRESRMFHKGNWLVSYVNSVFYEAN